MEYGVIRTATGEDTHVARLVVVDGETRIEGKASCGTYQLYVGSAMPEGTPVTCLHCKERLPKVVAQLGFADSLIKTHRTRAEIRFDSLVKQFEGQKLKAERQIARVQNILDLGRSSYPESHRREIEGLSQDVKRYEYRLAQLAERAR